MRQGLQTQNNRQAKQGFFPDKTDQDIRSLNSSILVITEKMKYLVRNEKVLGRNLIVLNKKLKALEERLGTGQFGSPSGSGAAAEMQQFLGETGQRIAALEAKVQQLSENTASKEELHEMHYIIDSINPLKFVTLDQAKDLMGTKSHSKKEKK